PRSLRRACASPFRSPSPTNRAAERPRCSQRRLPASHSAMPEAELSALGATDQHLLFSILSKTCLPEGALGILVGFDGSANSVQALEYGARLALCRRTKPNPSLRSTPIPDRT